MDDINELPTEPIKADENSSKHDFFIKAAEFIDKVLLFNSSNVYLGPMKKVNIESTETYLSYKIFNGSVPQSNEKVTMCLLGGKGTTKYSFNDLFSKPLNLSVLKGLKKTQNWNNTVIINTPKSLVKFVILKFPKLWQEIWEIPEYMFLYPINLDKIKFPDDMKGDFSDYLKLGIDPEGDPFIASIDLKSPAPEHIETLDGDGLEKLLKIKIKVQCYSYYTKQYITYKSKDIVEITDQTY